MLTFARPTAGTAASARITGVPVFPLVLASLHGRSCEERRIRRCGSSVRALAGWISITVAAVALALPATAQSASISFTGDVLTYNAAAGETNNLTLTLATLDFSCGERAAPCLDIQEIGGALTFLTDRCSDAGFGRAKCDAPGSVVVNLGDGEDAMFDWEGPSTIDGGAGNDPVLRGHGGADIINGGPGNDALFGGDGNDTLNGGDGNDLFEGFNGLSPEQPAQHGGTDVYVGGPGDDFVDYAGKTENLTITIDGAANDGAPGESDNVGLDVEMVRGGESADRIVGSGASNWLNGWGGNDEVHGAAGEDALFGGINDDRTFGGEGQDTIEGGDGNDLVDGGPGVDLLYGDELQVCIPSDCASGQDTIAARDGFDDTVYCGPGEDSATLDVGDLIPSSGRDVCERVDRPIATGGGTGAAPGATGAAPGATGAASGLTGAAPGAGGATGAADVTAPQLRDLRIGNVRRGRSTKVRFKLSEAATVSLTVQRRVKRRGKVRWVNVHGTLHHEGKAGSNERRFDGRLQGRRLKRGRYRLVVVARDAAGNKSRAKRVAFRVLR